MCRRQGIWSERELAALVRDSGGWGILLHTFLFGISHGKTLHVPASMLLADSDEDEVPELLEPRGVAEVLGGVVTGSHVRELLH